eukprot:c25343_g1_i1 orf=356-2314(-)
MAVLINTSLGDLVIDLHTDLCPLTTKNFLKLCKIKYYNNCLFHTVQKDFIAQTGDPMGTGSGGDSIYKFLYGDQARFFDDEIHPNLKHDKIGTVAMASGGENLNASQFYITTRASLDYLDGKHTVFGEVAEGLDTLMRINEAYVDEQGRPYKNIRIKHTYVLDDPFDDPIQLAELIPEKSPELKSQAEGEDVRLEDDWIPMDEQQDPEELEKSLREKEAHSRAVVLEMVGDIPEAEVKPPDNVLFVCKLNPVTQEEDLEIIFSRFGKIISADIIRDYKTGDSLCYAFIEFETNEACEAAYFKMDNVLIDDRRIHVDFSQSVAKLWSRYRRFGSKDKGDEGSNFPAEGKASGCFKCGEPGHFAKDCSNDDAKETSRGQEKPRYVIKDTGQHGGTFRKYEMLFEEGDGKAGDKVREGRKSREDGRSYKDDIRVPPHKRLREAEDTERHWLTGNEASESRRDHNKMDWRERRHFEDSRDRRDKSHARARSEKEEPCETVKNDRKKSPDNGSYHPVKGDTHDRFKKNVDRHRHEQDELDVQHSRQEEDDHKNMKINGREGKHMHGDSVEGLGGKHGRNRDDEKARQAGGYSRHISEDRYRSKDDGQYERHRHGRHDFKNIDYSRQDSRYNDTYCDNAKRNRDRIKDRQVVKDRSEK